MNGTTGWGLKDYVSVGGLAAIIIAAAAGYGAVTNRVATLEQRPDLTARVTVLEGRADLSDDVASLKTQLILIDRQLDRMETKIERIPRQ